MSNISQKSEEINKFDFSKAEETIQNITLPGSQFTAKWVKDSGYAIGIENIKITQSYETLEEALNKIGYGVEKNESGEEVLIKVGTIDFEVIVRIIRALLIVQDNNLGEEFKNLINKENG